MIIICPECEYVEEIEDFKDKLGWYCRKCHGAFEITSDGNIKKHMLHETARFTANSGGNVCTGMGGISGELFVRN